MLHAVDDVSFSMERGKTLGIVGESGCGKTTLGRTLVHLESSTSGQIFYEGEDITNVDRKRLYGLRQKMQMIFQDPYSSIDQNDGERDDQGSADAYQKIYQVGGGRADERADEYGRPVAASMDGISPRAGRREKTADRNCEGAVGISGIHRLR